VVKYTFEKSTEEICISTFGGSFRKSSRAQSALGEIIDKSQTAILEKKLEQASRSSIWSITKRHTMAHLKAIPELDGLSDFEGKYEKLRHFLFPEPLAPLLYINDDFVTPLQDLTEAFDVVTATEVARALKSVNKNSAVGNDHINFTTLIYVNKAMLSLLSTLITALFRFGIHHKSWKEAICVVFPKQGKKSYTTPISYRPYLYSHALAKLWKKLLLNVYL
jgi:hypothetical protein